MAGSEEARNLISMFIEENKHRWPELDKATLKTVCQVPFEYFRKEMESDRLPTVGIKHLGTFQVRLKTAKGFLANNKKQFEDATLSSRMYFKYKSILEGYISRIESQEDKRFKNNKDGK